MMSVATVAARACEKRRKVSRRRPGAGPLLLQALCAWLLAAACGPAVVSAQAPDARTRSVSSPLVEARAAQAPAQEQGERAAAEEGGAEEEHEESLFRTVARLINAVLLFGALAYFLRAPLKGYLEGRQKEVRRDLDTAAHLRNAAAEQLEELDQKMRALPGEIEGLKQQGAVEIAQEQARITEAAEAERQRLLEQTRREIDLQLRVAHRELVEHAAALAVAAAAERVKHQITDQDQTRLVDRYAEQLKQ
jgi:F-type H+-transporting ATPase subunit b